MNQVYFNSRYEWKKGDILKSYDLINNYLVEQTEQEVFSMPEDLLDKYYSNHLLFFNTLLGNDCLRAAFCDIFPILWENNPNDDLLMALVIRDFSKPSLVKKLGMEDFGFEDPEENFQKIIAAFRNTAKRGFLTSANQIAPYTGRVHIDFSYLKTTLLEYNWPDFKDELWAFEKELDSIRVTWDEISNSENDLLLATSLYGLFGRFDTTVKTDKEVIVTGSLQKDTEWLKAIVKSIEIAKFEKSDEELDELVKSSCQLIGMSSSGREWLDSFLNYSASFNKKAFHKLYN